MGSKTSEDGERQYNDGNSSATNANNGGGEPRGAHMARDGDGCLGSGGDDSDDDDDSKAAEAGVVTLVQGDRSVPCSDSVAAEQAGPAKSKKNKKKKKKKSRSKKAGLKQSSPPRVPLSQLFPAEDYAQGEVQLYTRQSTTAAEERHDVRQHKFNDEFLTNYRKAAEVHRQTRKWVQETVTPGQKLLDVAEGIEASVRALLGNEGIETGDSLKAGMGFPTGLSLNHHVAHYTPNPGQKDVVLQQQDVMKVDFGVHINGWIVDSAFTMSFDPTYDNLLAAVEDATNTGIKTAGVDVRICEVSAAIQEAMESYEVEIRGKSYPVKPVRNLSAHDIKQYHIHGGKSIPFVRNSDETKMEEGEVYAIETFGSTGRGYIRDDAGIYGYGLNEDKALSVDLPMSSAKRLHKTIRDNFGTIVFCRRYLDRLGLDKYLAGINSLISHGIVEPYGQLMDVKGSYSAQFEHTLLLHATHKEVVSRGEDY